MGSELSSLARKDIPPCTVGNVTIDARHDYECSGSIPILTALTIVHLVVLGGAFLLALLVYCIGAKLASRRAEAVLRALPGERLPVSGADLSRSMYKRVLIKFAQVSSDDTVPRPPPTNLLQGGQGWGAPGAEFDGLHFKSAILREADELLTAVMAAVPPAARNIPPTLRAYAPLLQKSFAAQPVDLLRVVTLTEQATHLDMEFTMDEFVRFRQHAWTIRQCLPTPTATQPGTQAGALVGGTRATSAAPVTAAALPPAAVEAGSEGGGESSDGDDSRSDTSRTADGQLQSASGMLALGNLRRRGMLAGDMSSSAPMLHAAAL